MNRFALLFTIVFSVGLVLGTGCAGGKPAADATTGPSNIVTPKGIKKESPPSAPKVVRSVFTIDQSSRDPFNPQNRKKPGDQVTPQQQITAADIPVLLTQGLQGIGGTPDHRIAIINNILLEEGQSATIPVRSGNQNRLLPVRCRKVDRRSVMLDVEGYGQLVVKQKQL